MEIGLIGLGKMGFNMAERLRLGGHKVVGFDTAADVVAKFSATGSVGVNTLEDLVKNLAAPRARRQGRTMAGKFDSAHSFADAIAAGGAATAA